MSDISNENRERMNARLKSLEEKGVDQITQEVKDLSAEIKKLDNLMAENVASGVINEKQQDVAEQLDELNNKVESSDSFNTAQSPSTFDNENFTRKNRLPPPKPKKWLKVGGRPKFNKKTQRKLKKGTSSKSPESLTTRFPSPYIDDLSPSSPPFQGIFTKKSRHPQPYQQFAPASKTKKSPLLLRYSPGFKKQQREEEIERIYAKHGVKAKPKHIKKTPSPSHSQSPSPSRWWYDMFN